MTFLLGADPELFIKNRKTGNFVSAESKRRVLIPGTKANPHEVDGGAIQVDGVAAEFNINPAANFQSFFGNIRKVVTNLDERIKAVNKDYALSPVPTATFNKRYFDDLPEHTKMLGCEPDFDAYTDGSENPRPSTDEPFRTGSGHIHIGWTTGADPKYEGHILDCCMVTKELDRYLHHASKTWDDDTKRMELYGRPGSFRPKPYGMEYRPLSNRWIKDQDTIRDVYLITMGVIRSLDSGRHSFEIPNYYRTTCPRRQVLYFLSEFTYDL